jgi:hypothetical protein
MDILAEALEENVTEDGTMSAGFLFASVKNVGSSVATVNGVPLAAGEAKSYPFIGKGYKAIPYQVNGSTLRIMKVI